MGVEFYYGVVERSCRVVDTSPKPFTQIYFIMGQMVPEKGAIQCVFALLPDKETSSYNKMWTSALWSSSRRACLRGSCPTSRRVS
jgi:hypothetical protein